MSVRPSSVAASFGKLLPRVAGGKLVRLPLPVRFWDGSVLSCDPHSGRPGAVITVSRRAVAHLLHTPGQLGLARAWVDGSLGVEGDLESGLAARNEFNGVSLSG